MEEEKKTFVLGSMRGVLAVAILAFALFYVIFVLDGQIRIENSITTASSTPVQILFVGDIMLDRSVRSTISQTGFGPLFERIKIIFSEVDLAIGNLEGSITENKSVSQRDPKILRFTFATSSAFDLKKLGFTHMNLANNHALDFGEFGLSDTEHYLEKAGIDFFGSPYNERNLSSMPIVRGQKVCLLGYHQLFNASALSVIKEIEEIKSFCNYIVVYTHWGEEYKAIPRESERNIGRAFIDAGADLVIGSHPHVIQPIEIYNNHAIFYSLGNFMFDQDFSLPTRRGLAVRLELSSTTQKFHLIGLEMEKNSLYFPEKEGFQPSLDILIRELPPVHKALADVDGVLILKRE